MESKQETYSTPRSGMGFVLALTLALFTFWGAGVVLQVRSYVVDPPIQRAAATPLATCEGKISETAPCEPATARP